MKLRIFEELGIRTCDAPLQKGDVVEGHAHNFGHVTYVPHGKLRIEKLDGPAGLVVRTVERGADDLINYIDIPAGVWHRLTALEDNTHYHCIYSHRDPETNEPVKLYNGWEDAYV